MTGIGTDYSQLYRGMEYTNNHGIGAGKSDTIEAQQGANVIVELSGDGLTALEEYKGKTSLPAEPEREVSNNHIMTDYSHEFASRMPSIYGDKDSNGEYSIYNVFSVTDTANNMLNVYASIYDEIVKGYENGTRETYIEDKNAEGGYRKLTMEEELDELNKAYKDYAERFAANRDEHVIDILSAYEKQIAEIKAGRAGVANEASALLEKYKNDPVPEDFIDNVMKAAKDFVAQYKSRQIENGGIKSESATTNTDKVDREIESLKEEKQRLEQQLQATRDDDKKAKLQSELSKVEAELLQKDNDSYRNFSAEHY